MKKFKKIKICNGKHECQFKLTLAEYGLNIDQTPTRFVLGSSHIQAQIGSDIGLIARSHDKGMIKHYSNEYESLKLLDDVIILYVVMEREKLKLPTQAALIIMDVFKRLMTTSVLQKTASNNIQ